MKITRPSWFPFDPSSVIRSFILAVLLMPGAISLVAAQSGSGEATPTETSGYIETVGGQTTRELPPSASYDADGNGTLDVEELSAAVRDRYPKMIWPETYLVPVEDIIEGARASGQESWEIGSEYRLLEVPTLCAWFSTYLDAYGRDDQLNQWAALDQAAYVLGGAHGLTDDEGEAAMDAIRYATLQDPEPVRAFLAEGPCGAPVGGTPVATPAGVVWGCRA